MVSEKFIEECKIRANANRLGKITIDGMENPITNSDNLQNFSIDSGCYVDGNIIGSVYAKCLKASFITDIADLSEKSINAQIGVKYGDTTTEYINMGKYIIERPNNEITANMSQITAYDDLYTNLDSEYVCEIDYSVGNITVKDLYIDVCKQLGLTPKTTSFINSNVPIINNPFTNHEKNRTVLQTVCKVACAFTDIDIETNEIDLCWLNQNEDPDYTFYKNDYVSVEGGKIVCGPINCLIIKNSQIDSENVTVKDEESITINGENSITINEDYILHNAELREQAINNIWNKVHGMKYIDCKLTTYYGKPFLKLGNKIRIYTSEDEYFDTYVLKHNFTYDGTFASVIESPALTKQEIKTKQDISLGQALKNTQIDVDKQNQKITEIVEQVSEYDEKISKVEQTVDEINQTVSEIANLEREITSNRIIHIPDAKEGQLLNLTINGELSYIYPENTLYPSDDLYPLASEFILVIDKTEKISDDAIQIKLPFDYLGKKDKFIVEDSKARIEKEDGTTVDLGEIQIPLFDGENYIHIKDYTERTGTIYAKYVVKNDYTDLFATKVELNSSITQTNEKIETEVNHVEEYLDKQVENLDSKITQTAEEINTEVSKKVGEDEIISKINQSAEEIQIEADKISLKGKKIEMTSDSIEINSTNLTIDKDGTLNCKNGNFTGNVTGSNIVGGTITLNSESATNNKFRINDNSKNDRYIESSAANFRLWDSGISKVTLSSILDSGMVSVGRTDGSSATLSSSGVNTSSDIRYKKDIENIKEETSKNIITCLNPISYTYKSGNPYHRGLSAQEVETVLNNNGIKNQIYSIDENGKYSLNYSELIPDLINCIKYLDKKINELEVKLNG